MGTEADLKVCTTLGCVRSGLNSASNAGLSLASVAVVASMICRTQRGSVLQAFPLCHAVSIRKERQGFSTTFSMVTLTWSLFTASTD